MRTAENMSSSPRTNAQYRFGAWIAWPPVLAGLVCALILLVACGSPETMDEGALRDEIEEVLEVYLPKLAAAHAAREPSQLDGFAVRKEQAALQFQIDSNTERGEHIVPELVRFTITDLTVARNTVFVSTAEVWALERRALGSDVLVQSYPDERFTVRYQLKKDDGRWLVYYRKSERGSE